MPTRCQHEGCKIQGNFNFADVVKLGRGYCRTHMLPGMIYKVSFPRCQHEGCSTQPSFGFPGRKLPGSHCFKHKLETMIRLRPQASPPRCKHTNEDGLKVCKLAGIYLKCHPNGKAAESNENKRCFAHKLPGQVNRANQCTIFKKQNSGIIARTNKKRVGAWERYNPESEVRVKIEEEGEEY